MTHIHTLRPGESPPENDHAFIHRLPSGEWAVTSRKGEDGGDDLLVTPKPSYADFEEAKGVALHWADRSGSGVVYVQEEPVSIGTIG